MYFHGNIQIIFPPGSMGASDTFSGSPDGSAEFFGFLPLLFVLVGVALGATGDVGSGVAGAVEAGVAGAVVGGAEVESTGPNLVITLLAKVVKAPVSTLVTTLTSMAVKALASLTHRLRQNDSFALGAGGRLCRLTDVLLCLAGRFSGCRPILNPLI
jgi:hypothetical protein